MVIPDVNFQLEIVDAEILDENSTEAPVAASNVNVIMRRTISADKWNTICLPFAMSEAQVKSAFGDDVKLADFTGITSTYEDPDTEEKVIGIKVNFATVTAIAENHPYLIKVSSEISKFEVASVTINPADASVDMNGYRTGSGTKKDPYVWHYNSFIGTYVAETEVPSGDLFISGNKFYYSKGTTKMKGFRGYF